MNYDKYLDDLNYEDADTVLGSVMSAAGFPKIENIEDACDVTYLSGNESDRKSSNNISLCFITPWNTV